MASASIQQEEIARAMQMSEKTLRKHFSEELECGKTKTIAKVADSLVRQALAGNVGAACFYLKTQAGWRETQLLEHTGRDGSALIPGVLIIPAEETDPVAWAQRYKPDKP